MKIYRVETIETDCSALGAREAIRANPGAIAWPVNGYVASHGLKPRYCVTIRRELLREESIEGKTLARMLPAWAKVKFPPLTFGPKVTAFYAINRQVITVMHECGHPVGSAEFHDWQAEQPDCFRSADAYRASKGEFRAQQ